MLNSNSGTLLIIDTLHPLCKVPNINLPQYLSSLLSPTTSLIAVYHSSLPSPSAPTLQNPYSPAPLTLLRHLATAIIKTHSLPHLLAQRTAQSRSLPPPAFGLSEAEEGIVQGLDSCDPDGVVLELEHRRKSGRAVGGLFYLYAPGSHGKGGTRAGSIILLEDHPLWRPAAGGTGMEAGGEAAQGDGEVEATFSLGLTERQRRAREGVVLPYFDAQKQVGEGDGGGPGDGGRILYDMGIEDDFDEEEDEI